MCNVFGFFGAMADDEGFVKNAHLCPFRFISKRVLYVTFVLIGRFLCSWRLRGPKR